MLLGNPIRKDLIDSSSKKAQGIKHFELDENKSVVLVIGGSLGARTINESMAALIDDLEFNDIQLIWQTGISFEKEALELTDDKKNIQVSAFILPRLRDCGAVMVFGSFRGLPTLSCCSTLETTRAC